MKDQETRVPQLPEVTTHRELSRREFLAFTATGLMVFFAVDPLEAIQEPARLPQAAGYPKAGDASIVKMSHPFDIFKPQVAAVIGLLFILVIYVTMVYGPIAAMLVELFPTRIRYTSMSLPYHIGNGWFGGLLPATAFAIVASTGDIYAGLWYPIIFAAITAVIGFIFLPETKDVDITKT